MIHFFYLLKLLNENNNNLVLNNNKCVLFRQFNLPNELARLT